MKCTNLRKQSNTFPHKPEGKLKEILITRFVIIFSVILNKGWADSDERPMCNAIDSKWHIEYYHLKYVNLCNDTFIMLKPEI